MIEKEYLLHNLDNIHTTELGVIRIKRNLYLEEAIDAVAWCKERIKEPTTKVKRKGKNYYATTATCVITVNASKLSIITAHKIKSKPSE
jgi:hypothetical protein